MIHVVCPTCEERYHFPAGLIGKQVRCLNKFCNALFVVGDDDVPQAQLLDGPPGPDDLHEASSAAAGIGAADVDSEREEEIEILPAEAIVVEAPSGAQLSEPHVPSDTAEPAAKPSAREDRRTRGERRTRNLRRFVAASVILLGVASSLMLWIYRDELIPDSFDPQKRWAEIMDHYDGRKWARVKRGLDKFQQDFPQHEKAAGVPFFQDLCDAGDDVYSFTGDARRGLAAVQRIFKDHRDNPAYQLYCVDIYMALDRLVERFVGRGTETTDPRMLARAREAHDLMKTVGRQLTEDWVAEKTGQWNSRIDRADRTVRLALARRRACELLDSLKLPRTELDPDEVYAGVERIRRAHPSLLGDRELIGALESAKRAEAEKVRYEALDVEALGGAPMEDQRDLERQANTLAVVWGGGPDIWGGGPGIWRGGPDGTLTSQRDQTVLALARGILYAFDKTGKLRWVRRLGVDSGRLPQYVRASRTAPRSLIAVDAQSNSLLSLDEATGEVLWRYRVGHDVVAPLTIVPRQPDPNDRPVLCGFLPTTRGEIHVLELARGRRIGRFVVNHPLTEGGTYDAGTRLAFFPADSKRMFAVNPACIDRPEEPACRSILFTDHASGALRSAPVVVGQYLIVSEVSELEHTRLRVFRVTASGFATPTAPPLKEVTLAGWAWFGAHSTPDRITLVTDQGHLGVFGLNLDNEDEALYPIVQDAPSEPIVQLSHRGDFRTMTVHAEEHMLWIMAGGRLQAISVDVLRQETKTVWSDTGPDRGACGVPVHEAQFDAPERTFFLTGMSPGGNRYRIQAVDVDSGSLRWQCQLGVNLAEDPLIWGDSVVLIDRTGRSFSLHPQTDFVGSDQPRVLQLADDTTLPEQADDWQLMRFGEPPHPVHLVKLSDDATRVWVRRIDEPHDSRDEYPDSPQPWREIVLNGALHGRPCICGDFLVVPSSDGQLYRYSLDTAAPSKISEMSFTWARSKPPGPSRADVYCLGPETVLLIDDQRRLRRLALKVGDLAIQWEQQGDDFLLRSPIRGRPLLLDDGLFVFTADGTLFRLDPENPNQCLAQWNVGVNVTNGPFARNDMLLAVVDDRRLVCIDPKASADDQQPRWISEPFGGRIRGLPALAGDTLLVTDNSRRVSGVRLADGTVAWTTRLAMLVGPSQAAVPYGRGRMLVPLSDGTFVVLPIPKDEPLESGDEPLESGDEPLESGDEPLEPGDENAS